MRRSPALAFLLVTIFIDALGLSIVVPIVPPLLTSLTGTASAAAHWLGIIGSSYGLLQFLVAPFLGRLSDRYGRKPVLVGALTMLGVDYLAHATAPSPWLFVAAHALAGAFAGTWTVVNAYVADVVESAGRPKAFGMIGSAFSLGFVAGPAIGGLLGDISVRLPFYVAAGLAFANALYGLLLVPESRTGDRRTSLGWRVANPFSSIAMVLRRPVLRRVTLARLFSDLARMANQVVWVFVMIARFGWSTGRVGVLMAVGAIAGAALSAWLAGPFVRLLGHRRAAVICSVAGAAGLAGFAVAPAGMIYLAMGVGAFAGIGGTAMQAWLSDLAGDDEQGTVQGALTGLGSLAEMCVPIAATAIFAWSLGHAAPGLVLLVAAGFALTTAVVIGTTRSGAVARTGAVGVPVTS